MAEQGVKAKMIVTECREVFKGTDKNQKPYVIHAVKATLPDGRTIDRALSTFEPVPIDGQVREFKVTGPRDVRGTPTWTIALPFSAAKEIAELRRRVEALEARLAGLQSRPEPQSAPAAQSSQSAPY